MATSATVAPALKKTALNATHRALKAKMVDFGGWDMPVEYPGPGGGLIAEHMAVRTGVGLFDVSHMGEIQFRGPGSLAAVQHITMNDASRLKDGQAHYSALLTPQGTFVDDILVHRLGENDYLLVVNAGTKDKDYAWIRQQVGSWPGIHISDYSSYYSQLALQGPRALETLQKLTKVDLRRDQELLVHVGTGRRHPQRDDRAHRLQRRRRIRSVHPLRRSDDGKDVECADGSRRGVRHSPLRTRRAQHAASRSGHEPLRPRDFRGDQCARSRPGPLSQARQGRFHRPRCVAGSPGERRTEAQDHRPRNGRARHRPRRVHRARLDGKQIGVVTSGSPAPFLKTNIAMALVPASVAASGTDVLVQCRANSVRAKQVPMPFYKRPKK